MRHDVPRAMRSDQIWVGCQDTWRGIHRTYIELGSDRFGFHRFSSAAFGSVQPQLWMLPFHNVGLFCKPNRLGSILFSMADLAVWMMPKASSQSLYDTSFNTYLTENVTRRGIHRKWSVSLHDKSDATWRAESYVERLEWIRLSGYLKRCTQNLRRARSGSVRLASVRFGSVRPQLWMLPFRNVALFSKLNRLGSVPFGMARLKVWMTPKASSQSLYDTSFI